MLDPFKLFLVLVILYLVKYPCQSQFIDDFSDGDFSASPAWVTSNESGNGVDFQVSAGELQSNGPAATSKIWISNSQVPDVNIDKVEWIFKVRYSSAPSSSNYVDIYLLSNSSDLSTSPEGYFIRLGESGSNDGIDLYKSSSGTALISDPNPSVASGIDVNIKVTRETNGDWILEADPSGGSSFNTIGIANDSEFTTGSYFGFKVAHSSTRNQSFFFDDISVSSSDIVPPVLSTIDVVSNTRLALTFSEEMDSETAEDINNYVVNNGIGNPISALSDELNPSIVYLNFSVAFANGMNQQIQLKDITDLAGNIITPTQAEFMYFIEEPAYVKDVIINEIFANPSPPNDLPEVEFVELYNNSNKTFDLSDWSFADISSVSVLDPLYFHPGDLLILCPEAEIADFESYGLVMGLETWPTLNNAGDFLIIKDNYGITIDSVEYHSSWYNDTNKAGGGWSLELVNPYNLCHTAENWSAAVSTSGGTPGKVNSVYNEAADITPPELLQAVVVDESTIRLIFSETLDLSSMDSVVFKIDGSIVVSSATLNDNLTDLTVHLSAAIETNTRFNILVDKIYDCSGNNVSGKNNADFILVEPVDIAKKDVVINEIFPKPDEETGFPVEYIELFNNSEKLFNLRSWTFSDPTTTAEFPDLILFPNEYVVVCKSSDLAVFKEHGKVVGLSDWPSLNNAGDALSIRDATGITVDSVNYDDGWYKSSSKAGGGWSLELIDPDNLCSNENNWSASEHYAGGTPGGENSVLSEKPDLTPPKLDDVIGLLQDSVGVRFDETLDPQDIQAYNFKIEPDIEVKQIHIQDNLQDIGLQLANPLQGGINYTLTAANIKDCSGNVLKEATADFHLIEEADSLDLIINEVLFNPYSGGVDFVELYNNSEKYINLKGWFLANAIEHHGKYQPDEIDIITTKNIILKPARYLAISEDEIVLKEQYPTGKADSFYEATDIPAYGDDGGTVILLRSDSATMDLLEYSQDFHFKLLTDVEGVSLERLVFSGPTSSQDNWKSAASTVGFATPGYANSQLAGSMSTNEGNITADPQVIIPDGSGQNDYTTISYSFDQAGYVANTRIVDVYGRTIKILGENEYLPAEGFFTWDATDENGYKVRTGYYLIYCEVFNLNGETVEFKEKVVVGTKF